MYEEFIQPYHERIAELFGKVYYHGCENLTQKAGIIKRLPNLRRFHISPWSDMKTILGVMGEGYVYEVHVQPANHLFVLNNRQIFEDIAGTVEICKESGAAVDLNLSDIETVKGDPSRIVEWAKIARDAAAMR